MKFKELPSTILGDYGESFIPEFAESKLCHYYKPGHEKSFPVDSSCMNRKGRFFGIEAKTKPRMKYYDYTGFDYADWITYTSMESDVYVLFIDSITNSIYGQWTARLEKQPTKRFGKTITFPLSGMTHYRYLTEDEVTKLDELSNSNYT